MIRVTSGFKGFREINTVTYDPGRISPEAMVAALKAAGTYLGQVKAEAEPSSTPGISR